MTHRECIQQLLETLSRILEPFVKGELQTQLGHRWEDVARSIRGTQRRPEVAWNDPHVQLRVIAENWRPVFSKVLSRADHVCVTELQRVRNRWAHYESFTQAETESAIDAAARLVSSISPENASRITELRGAVGRNGKRHPEMENHAPPQRPTRQISLGIDIGACYLKMVYYREDEDSLHPVRHSDGNLFFRVCGAVRDSATIEPITTDIEREAALLAGSRIVENVKALRGEADDRNLSHLGEQLETAVLVQALEQYRSSAQDPDFEKLKRIVLAHPVNHRSSKIETLKRIARNAGLPSEHLDTIEEPTAMAFFATRTTIDFSGPLFIVDGGHYTTDFVEVRCDNRQEGLDVRASNYLSAPLGGAEAVHRIAQSVWLKGQMVGGISRPSASPFDLAGPESQHPVVQSLSAWAEEKVLRALSLDWFSNDTAAILALDEIPEIKHEPWVSRIPGGFIEYFFSHDASLRHEDLDARYPFHARHLEDWIRQANFVDSIQPVTDAFRAATFGALIPSIQEHPIEVLFGGGISHVSVFDRTLSELAESYSTRRSLTTAYEYPGVPPSLLGHSRLLATAAGAALSASRRASRGDTLSHSIGVVLSMDPEEALMLLDENDALPAGFEPNREHLARLGFQLCGDQARLPVIRRIATEGENLPLRYSLPEWLVAPQERAGVLLFTRMAGSSEVAQCGPNPDNRSDVLAAVTIPHQLCDDPMLGLRLKIERNGIWSISLVGRDGQTVHATSVNMEFK